MSPGVCTGLGRYQRKPALYGDDAFFLKERDHPVMRHQVIVFRLCLCQKQTVIRILMLCALPGPSECVFGEKVTGLQGKRNISGGITALDEFGGREFQVIASALPFVVHLQR